MRLIPVMACLACAYVAAAQGVPSPAVPITLTDPGKLMLDVEANEKGFEAAKRDYTYKVHVVNTDLHSDGSVKKTTVTDADSFTIDGVRVNRVFARDGKPLTPEEAQKEDDRVDKEVAKAKAERAHLQSQGKATDDQGEQVITASRILELGTFSNIRPGEFSGRPVWLVDYAGDPDAKTKNEFEGVIRDLVGTVWIDQKDHALVAAHGEFRDNFRIGAGLIMNVHKGLSFDFRAVKVDDEVWLPASIQASGSLRYLLFISVNGSLNLETSGYKKFRTNVKLLPGNPVVDNQGKPLPDSEQPPQTPISPPENP